VFMRVPSHLMYPVRGATILLGSRISTRAGVKSVTNLLRNSPVTAKWMGFFVSSDYKVCKVA
jgi:hypothetical protein